MTTAPGASAAPRRRLLYLCDWLPPDFGAVGQYSLQFARDRAAAGEEVTLVGLSSTRGSEDVEIVGAGRLRVVRLHAEVYDRANFRRRALWTARTNLRLLLRARPFFVAADEVLFTGSPPFLLHFVVPLNVLLRRRLTYRITDFHPECLIAELGRTPWGLAAFRALTGALRRRVDRFEVLGEDQRRRLRALDIPDHRIVLKRDPSPVAFPPGLEPLRRPPELAGRVALLYSGNYGVAHDDATFVEGYTRHHRHGSGRVALWLNATGAKADVVEAELRRRGLPIHRGRPVPLADVAALLLAPDAHLVTLRDAFVGYVLPSKIHACLASGKPVLFVGSRESDVDLLARTARVDGSYLRVDEGDAAGVAAALEALAERVDAARRVRA